MTTKSKPKLNAVATRWVEALRSGKFKKGRGRLKTKQGTYCCLGVACELYRQEKGKGEWVKGYGNEWVFRLNGEDFEGQLPQRVARWLGLSDCDGEFGDYTDNIVVELAGRGWTGLININDESKIVGGNSHNVFTFKQIADVIASKPGKLFGKLQG